MANPWGKPRNWDLGDKNLVTRGTGLSTFVGKNDRIPDNPDSIKYRPGDWKQFNRTTSLYGTLSRGAPRPTLKRSISQGQIGRYETLERSASGTWLNTPAAAPTIQRFIPPRRSSLPTPTSKKTGIPQPRVSYGHLGPPPARQNPVGQNRIQSVSTPFSRANSMSRRRSRPPVSMNNMNVRANQVVRSSSTSGVPSRTLTRSKSTTGFPDRHHRQSTTTTSRTTLTPRQQRSKSMTAGTSRCHQLSRSISTESLPRRSSLKRTESKEFKRKSSLDFDLSEYDCVQTVSFSMDYEKDIPGYNYSFSENLNSTQRYPAHPPLHETMKKVKNRVIITARTRKPSRTMSPERRQSLSKICDIAGDIGRPPTAKELIKFYKNPKMVPAPQLVVLSPRNTTFYKINNPKIPRNRQTSDGSSDDYSSIMSFTEYEQRRDAYFHDINDEQLSDKTISDGPGLSGSSSSLEIRVDRVITPVNRSRPEESSADEGTEDRPPENITKKEGDHTSEVIKPIPPFSSSSAPSSSETTDSSDISRDSSSRRRNENDVNLSDFPKGSDIIKSVRNEVPVIVEQSNFNHEANQRAFEEKSPLKISKDATIIEVEDEKPLILNAVKGNLSPGKCSDKSSTTSDELAYLSDEKDPSPGRRRKSVHELLRFYERKSSSTSPSPSTDRRSGTPVGSSVRSPDSTSPSDSSDDMKVIHELESIVRDERRKMAHARAYGSEEAHEKLIPDEHLAQDLKLLSDLSSGDSWSDNDRRRGGERKYRVPYKSAPEPTKHSSGQGNGAYANAIRNRTDHPGPSSSGYRYPVMPSPAPNPFSSDLKTSSDSYSYSSSSYTDSSDASLPEAPRPKSTPPFLRGLAVRPVRTSFSQQTLRLLESRRQTTVASPSRQTMDSVLAKSGQACCRGHPDKHN